MSSAWLEGTISPLKFGLSGLGLLGLTLGACARADAAPDASPARRVVVVGAATDTYAYSFSAPQGGVEGFSVDILDAVARTMHLDLRRVAGSNRDIQARFVQGEFDCLQAYSFSADREDIANFSVPYLSLDADVFVRKGGPVRRLEDLAGRPFAIVGQGSEGATFLREHHLQTRIYNSTSAEDALRRVQSGECAGTFLSRLTALSVIYHSHLTGLAALGGATDHHQIHHSFAVHRDDAALLAVLNEGLAIVYRTGEYDRIYRRWFGGIDAPLFTPRQLVASAGTALALALLTALGGAFWQRSLRKRIARQAPELAGQRALLQALYDHIPVGMTVIELAGGRRG